MELSLHWSRWFTIRSLARQMGSLILHLDWISMRANNESIIILMDDYNVRNATVEMFSRMPSPATRPLTHDHIIMKVIINALPTR